MSKIFAVYTVHRNNDDRYSGPVTDVCSTREIAEKVAAGSGWYGGNAPVYESWAVEVEGKVYLLSSITSVDLDGQAKKYKQLLKEQALNKLSKEEIKVLGLN